MPRYARSLLATVAFACCPLSVWSQTLFERIGLSALQSRLGAGAPTGAGVEVMQGEAILLNEGPNAYLPNWTQPQMAGKTFIDRSAGGILGPGTFSTHATGVGNFFYGTQAGIGVAPGITTINAYRVEQNYDAGDWLGPAYLNFGAGLPVATPSQRVQNHSWIDRGAFGAVEQETTRRYDYALRRDNAIGVVAVDNGTAFPNLIANSYNSIAVGIFRENPPAPGQPSSIGPTIGDVPGRSKPDLVAPIDFTSTGAPVVAGSAALLVQTADQMGNPNAGRLETIKSVLLTGATKEPFANLAQPWTRTNNGSYVEPLDRRYGAGQVNVNNSHLILTAGQKNGTDLGLDGPLGWDFQTLTAAGQTRTYYVSIPVGLSVEFSATVDWLRRITPTGTGSNLFATSDATLSTVELRLYNTNPDLSLAGLIDSSISPIDNVQHIYRTDLLTNTTYALQVTLAGMPSGQSSEDIGVSWHALVTVPEPQSIITICVAAVIALGYGRHFYRRRSKLAESLLVDETA